MNTLKELICRNEAIISADNAFIKQKLIMLDIEVLRKFLITRISEIETQSTSDGIVVNGNRKQVQHLHDFCSKITGDKLVVINYKGHLPFKYIVVKKDDNTKPHLFWRALSKVIKCYSSKYFITPEGNLLTA